MLTHLSVKNYALIRELEFNPAKGLNVITGETGAGKSILLGALGLVLGQRADHAALYQGTDKCIVEAHFDIERLGLANRFAELELDYDSIAILRREINQGGKSRAFINDTPVSLAVLKEIGELLVEIQTQSSGVLIRDSEKQYQLLDDYAGNDPEKKQYRKDFVSLNKLKKELEDVRKSLLEQDKEKDYLQFQLNELLEIGLKEAEEETIEQELATLSHAIEISSVLEQAELMLSNSEQGIVEELAELRNQLRSIQSYYPEVASYLKKIEEMRIELQETARDFSKMAGKVEQNPEKLQALNERWNRMNTLFRKHGVNESTALIAIAGELEAKLSMAKNTEQSVEELENAVRQAAKRLTQSATALSNSRKKVAAELGREITAMLNELEMPDARLEVNVSDAEIYKENGADKVEIRFTANAGKALQPIEKSASGGELSRILFGSKAVIARKKSLPTLILDEADTGVSGVVADTMGRMMRNMAQGMQLIAITHLPQVAAKGEFHYFVYKEKKDGQTHSQVKLLKNEEREKAIAAMLGGKGITEAALVNARELLSI